MTKVQRSDLIDYATYEEQRQVIRTAALEAKDLRRIVIGEHFTFLFENKDTVRYQVLEMMRVERLVKEADIEHELKTYNELLHGKGKLGCTLLIGIDDEELRDEKLRQWIGLNDHIYAKLPNGGVVRPTWDPRQVGDDRLSAVQYLVFEFGQYAPITIGIDMVGIREKTEITAAQQDALQKDLDAE